MMVISCRECVWDGNSSFDYLFAIYRVACVQLAHSSSDVWKDIFITHLIIIIKSEVSLFPVVLIFSVVVCLRWLYYHILSSITYISREHRTLFPLLMWIQSIVFANDRIHYGLWGVLICLQNYTISLSSLCRLIERLWTTKMLVRYMLPSVCLRLRQFFQVSFIQYMGLCVFSLLNSPVMIVRICTLSYYHHPIGSMSYYVLMVQFYFSVFESHLVCKFAMVERDFAIDFVPLFMFYTLLKFCLLFFSHIILLPKSFLY